MRRIDKQVPLTVPLTDPTVQGWINGLCLILQYFQNSRPQGGPKMAKNSLINGKKTKKNSKSRSFFGLVPE